MREREITEEQIKNEPLNSVKRMLNCYSNRSVKIQAILTMYADGNITPEKALAEIAKAIVETSFA